MTWRFPLRCASCVVVVAALLTAAEAGLRRAGWLYQRGAPHQVVWSLERDRRMAREDDLYRFDPHTLWAPRPGALLPWTTGEHFNELGFRGPLVPVERPKRTLRIAALGGAGTLGVGVQQDQTFTALAARLVSQRIMTCDALNLGVENYSIRQCLERYRDLARPFRPHVVVVSVTTRASYAPAPGGLTDELNIERCRPLERTQRQRPPSAPSGLRVVQGLNWIWDAALGPYWEDRDFQFQLKRLEPSARRLDWPGVRRVPMNDYYGSLSYLLQEATQDGAHVILLELPSPDAPRVSPIEGAYDRVAEEFAKREGLILLGAAVPQLAGLASDMTSTDTYGSDRFPSACGHAMIAEALADAIVRGIVEKAALPPPPKEPPRRSQ